MELSGDALVAIAFNAVTWICAIAVNKNDIKWIKSTLEKLEAKVG
ncbi:hypothetical protein [Pseudoalteromonas rubra]|nr:hypothetical protein [Pseudoalteromonas rubra]MEC4091154.1 hypothetical protein [Pseudoalteromonas rubra]